MTDNRERPGKKERKRELRAREKEKDTDRARWGEKDGDLVEQKKQFSIRGQREA